MIQPTNKYLMDDYRQTLGTNDAPQMINTEIPVTPVVIVNPGLPKISSKQKIYTYLCFQAQNTAAKNVVIQAVNSSLDVYLLSVKFFKIGTVNNSNAAITDNSSAATPTFADGSTNVVARDQWVAATPGDRPLHQPSNPIKLTQGLQVNLSATGAAEELWAVVTYMTEEVQK